MIKEASTQVPIIESLTRAFVSVNAALSGALDRVMPASLGPVPKDGGLDVRGFIGRGMRVADIGGGKKPYLSAETVAELELDYVGLDIDADELRHAPPIYSETAILDITADVSELHEAFDVIVCMNTLEHVLDAEKALENLLAMLRPGGRLLLVCPCRHALFARLNLALPQDFKKRLLHGLFPQKRTDGFPTHYDRGSPAEFRSILEARNARILWENRSYWSSYFRVFFPAYLVWRAISLIQLALVESYCERFWLLVRKAG